MKHVLLLIVGFFLWGQAVAQDKDAPKDRVLNGDAKCTRCHDENDTFPVLAIGKTKHGTRADARTPTCTSCHGESDGHINKPASGARPKPDITFSKTSRTPPETKNQACLNCHQGGKRSHWQGSMHATREVACSSCHDVHSGHDRSRDKLEQAE